MPPLSPYTKFHTQEEAADLIELLKNADIPFEVEQNKDLLDKIYIGENFDPMISLLIESENFETVNELVRSHAKTQIHTLSPDYYLFHFTDHELMEVVQNKTEWNPFDQGIAAKLLADRNVEIVSSKAANVVAADYQPIHLDYLVIIIQYIVSAFIPYVGIIMGLATMSAYKTLHNGRRVKIYDQETRYHAVAMIAIGIVRLLITFNNTFDWF